MTDFSILQKGNIYFFYRPKVQHTEAHNLEEVQRFFMALNPQNVPNISSSLLAENTYLKRKERAISPLLILLKKTLKIFFLL